MGKHSQRLAPDIGSRLRHDLEKAAELGVDLKYALFGERSSSAALLAHEQPELERRIYHLVEGIAKRARLGQAANRTARKPQPRPDKKRATTKGRRAN